MRCPYVYRKVVTATTYKYDDETGQPILSLQTTLQEVDECTREDCGAYDRLRAQCNYGKEM